MPGLRPLNGTLLTSVHIQGGHAESVTFSVSCDVQVGGWSVRATIDLWLEGTSRASLTLAAADVQATSILKPLLGDELTSKLSETSLREVTFSYISVAVQYGGNDPLRAIFHVQVGSLKNFIQRAVAPALVEKLKFMHLDSLLKSFDINDISATVVLEAGTLSLAITGYPVLPKLQNPPQLNMYALNIGSENSSFKSLTFSVS